MSLTLGRNLPNRALRQIRDIDLWLIHVALSPALLPRSSCSPAPTGARARSSGRPVGRSRRPDRRPARRTVPACSHCCRRIRSPSTALDLPSGKLAYTATAGTFSLVRSIRRTLGRDLLHRLHREVGQSGAAARHLRLQRRSGRGVGLSQSRPGRAARRAIRHGRPRRLERPSDRQSRHLARLSPISC